MERVIIKPCILVRLFFPLLQAEAEVSPGVHFRGGALLPPQLPCRSLRAASAPQLTLLHRGSSEQNDLRSCEFVRVVIQLTKYPHENPAQNPTESQFWKGKLCKL